MRLADATIRALQPASFQKFYRDPSLKGLGVGVSPQGTKTFALMHGADRRLTTIGRYGILILQEARDAAKRLLAQIYSA
jgi:hypothetical protein